MTITLASAQYPITRHPDFKAWEIHTAEWVHEAARQGAQLLLFPEYGSMELVSLLDAEAQADIRLQVREMEHLLDDFCAVYARLARRYGVVIAAPSFPVRVGDRVFNRCFVFGPQGGLGYQDKYFMTRFESETWGVHRAPARLCVFEADWGCFGIQICYDVEFPVGAALLGRRGATLLLAPSCTETIRGSTRVHVGARARALEQQCFVAVSPVIGDAPWSLAVDVNYGFAACYGPPDRDMPEEGVLAVRAPLQAGWLVQELDLSALDKVRQDGQTLNFRDQGDIGYTMRDGAFEVVRTQI
ncbi:MAG: carbon-nitrogen hydrolase family protein [Lewinellaceae bacterium]|nr:carbon-nitrogen hydrolase family protein [Lewinellaceae bacterium]